MRHFAGVIAGYGAMTLVEAATFCGIYLVVGADIAFKPESWQISVPWSVLSIVVAFMAACIGGKVCQFIAGSRRGPLYLIIAVLLLGISSAVTVGEPSVADPRTIDPEWREALNSWMDGAHHPTWLLYLYPLCGAWGIAVGSRLLRKQKARTVEPDAVPRKPHRTT